MIIAMTALKQTAGSRTRMAQAKGSRKHGQGSPEEVSVQLSPGEEKLLGKASQAEGFVSALFGGPANRVI